MTSTAPDTPLIRELLRDTFVELDGPDDDELDAAIDGQEGESIRTPGGARLNWPELLDLVRTWAPVAANVFTIAKGAYDIWKSGQAKKPTEDDVLAAYEREYGPVPADRASDMRRLSTVALTRASK